MVRHVILWNLKDEYDLQQKEEIKKGIKQGLESLPGKVPGLLAVKVNTEPLPSSNCDVMLDATLADVNALKNYAVHPEHVAIANTFVRPFTCSRVCMDYEVSES